MHLILSHFSHLIPKLCKFCNFCSTNHMQKKTLISPFQQLHLGALRHVKIVFWVGALKDSNASLIHVCSTMYMMHGVHCMSCLELPSVASHICNLKQLLWLPGPWHWIAAPGSIIVHYYSIKSSCQSNKEGRLWPEVIGYFWKWPKNLLFAKMQFSPREGGGDRVNQEKLGFCPKLSDGLHIALVDLTKYSGTFLWV